MDERDALSEVSRGIFESYDFCRKGRRGRKVFVLFAFFVAKTIPRSPFPNINLKFAWQKVTAFEGEG